MMEENKLDLMLLLRPIQELGNNTSAPDGPDGWLENDDSALICAYQTSDSQNNSIIPLYQKIASENGSTRQISHVRQLAIKQTLQGFVLHTEEGNIALKTGDRIQLDMGAFEVEIIKKQRVVNPDPASDGHSMMQQVYDDIWTASDSSSMPSMQNIESSHQFSSANVLPSRYQLQDPLGFLYENPVSVRQDYFGIIPRAEGIGSLSHDPLASLLSPMPAPHISLPERGGLDFQTGPYCHFAAMAGAAMPIHPNKSTTPQTTGFAVPDNHGHTWIQNTAVTQQSPVDMLDEYLTEDYPDPSGEYPQHAVDPNRYKGIQNRTAETLVNAFRGFKNKNSG